MREIKFRAWDKHHNKMLYSDGFTLNGEPMSYAEQLRWFFFHVSNEQPADDYSPVMQYSCLKDKNGVEIYEGDIVRIGTLEGEPLGEIEWDEKYAQYEINDNAKYKFGGEYVEHHRAQSFEVIGNVYENPELLK